MARIPPMEYLGPAVRQIRKEKRLTLEAVANQVPGYDSGNLSRFERGAQSIDADKLKDIAGILGRSVSEIYALAEQLEKATRTHLGELQQLAHRVSEQSQPYPSTSAVDHPRAIGLKSSAEDQRRPLEAPALGAWEFVLIPSVAVVTDRDGRSTISVDQAAPVHPIPRALFDGLGIPLERARLIQVKGDAMLASLADGDFALIDLGDTAIQSGRVYALLVQDEIWLRRLMKTPTGVIVSADNKSGLFDDFTLSLAEFKAMQVIGRVRLRWGSSGL